MCGKSSLTSVSMADRTVYISYMCSILQAKLVRRSLDGVKDTCAAWGLDQLTYGQGVASRKAMHLLTHVPLDKPVSRLQQQH